MADNARQCVSMNKRDEKFSREILKRIFYRFEKGEIFFKLAFDAMEREMTPMKKKMKRYIRLIFFF